MSLVAVAAAASVPGDAGGCLHFIDLDFYRLLSVMYRDYIHL